MRASLLGREPVSSVATPLCRASLGSLAGRVSVPTYAAADLRPGIVHLGLGAFARAHQAVYFDRLAEQGLRDWGMVGSGLRSGWLAEPLARQDHLWTVVETGTGRARVVGVLQRYVAAAQDAGRLIDALADPETRLVTVTVTAPAYSVTRPRVAGGDVFELLAEGLDRRRQAGLGGFTVLSCDNLPDSGATMRSCVLVAADRREPALTRWIEAHVAFPSSMVDRITPGPTVQQRRALRHRHGIADRIPVLTEPFSQWVVADEFGAGRPPLEDVGVQLVSDVAPFVAAKTRLLNASHLALGFLGSRAGHPTTAAAMRDPQVAGFVRRLMREEVAPLLPRAAGLDFAAYQRQVLARLADDAVPDPVARLCRRGSVRVHNYVLPSLRAALGAGAPRRLLTRVVAAWLDHLVQAAELPGGLDQLEDPLAARLAPLARRAPIDVAPLLAVEEVFDDLGRHPAFAADLQETLVELEAERRVVAS